MPMGWVAAATAVGGYLSSQSQKSAGEDAANAQEASAQAGINEQHDEFGQVKQLLAPYANAGTSSLSAQQNLLGLNGNGAQQSAITALQNSPAFTSMLKRGENSILSNASATGGLRGGNTQAALAQFSPQLLAQTINGQFSNLGGLTSLGENAAAGTGNAALQTGNNVSNLLQQSGAAQAGADLNAGKANANAWNSVAQGIGEYYGAEGKF